MTGSPLVVLTGGNGSVFMTIVTYIAMRPANTIVSITRLSVLPHQSGDCVSISLAGRSLTSIVCDGNAAFDVIAAAPYQPLQEWDCPFRASAAAGARYCCSRTSPTGPENSRSY